MDYGILIALLAYIVGIQAVSKFDLSPTVGASISVVVPFLISALIGWIITGADFSSIWGDVINLTTVLTFVIQFILMFFLLRYLKSTESTIAYLLLSLAGYFVIILFIPFTIGKLL